MNGAPPLKIQLFGRMEAEIHGRPLPRMRSRKELWLLALLALESGRDVSRVWLSQTLWPSPDYSTDLANNYLRRSLMELRKALGEEAGRLQSGSARSVSFDLTGAYVDALVFDAAVARRDPASLEEAVGRYSGALLTECTEGWAAPLRERYAQAYGRALDELSARAMAVGNYEDAERYLRRAVAAEPLSEPARRTLMEALRRAGDLPAALRVYHELEDLLKRENAVPSEDTVRLFRRIAGDARRSAGASREKAAPPVPPASGYIPSPVTDLVGRKQDIVEVKTALSSSRLVTLVGTGGVGKTRLVLQVADEVREDYPDGVWFVDLAPLTDPKLAAQAVASVLGVRDDAGSSLDIALTDYLRPRSALLVLDNCEHIIDACALLTGRLLAHARDIRILATSRQALGLMGERVWRVPSLPCPSADTLPKDNREAIRLVSGSPATKLFIDRATAVDNRFAVNAGNARIVAHLCQRLDGIPLAIELAAARVRVLTVEEILDRLDNRFRLLTSGSKTVLPRQQTLHALIEWSYNLLTPAEQQILARLSVFRGGCTLEAAEAVCAGGAIDAFEVLDLLTALVDKSLAFVDRDTDGHSRYRLLENVRAFAAERLRGDEADMVRMCHAEWFAVLVQEAEPKLRGPEQLVWLQKLTADRGNIWAAVDWSCALPPESDLPLRLVSGLWRYWFTQGRFWEGCARLTAALKDRVLAGRYAAWTLFLDALFAELLGDASNTEQVEKGLRIAAEAGDEWSSVFGRYILGWTQRHQEWSLGMATIGAALDEARVLGDAWLMAEILNTLGFMALYVGDADQARALLLEGEALVQRTGDRWLASEFTYHLALLKSAGGNYSEGRQLFEDTLRHQRVIGDQNAIGATIHCLGWIAVAENDYERARGHFHESLQVRVVLGFRRGMIASLEGIAYTEAHAGDCKRATELLAALSVLRSPNRSSLLQFWKFDPDELTEHVRANLPSDHFRLTWSRGEKLTLEDAVALVTSAENPAGAGTET